MRVFVLEAQRSEEDPSKLQGGDPSNAADGDGGQNRMMGKKKQNGGPAGPGGSGGAGAGGAKGAGREGPKGGKGSKGMGGNGGVGMQGGAYGGGGSGGGCGSGSGGGGKNRGPTAPNEAQEAPCKNARKALCSFKCACLLHCQVRSDPDAPRAPGPQARRGGGYGAL
eukprot:4902958-Amphidinium_carterae.1